MTKRTGVIVAVVAVVAAVAAWLLWPADDTPSVSRSAAGPYQVQLQVPGSVHTGDNTVDLTVTDAQGNSATPDKMSVEPAMPQMGHALPPSATSVVTPGHYRATVHLPMPGQWEIAVKLSGAPGSGSAVFSVQAN
ncbi:FixH family protein [Nocardia tengchongensis]|uniref:FixH family protein n=1 Tax=Nocardia tengchongensis TaxID=2055889 RepID=UPI0036B4E322